MTSGALTPCSRSWLALVLTLGCVLVSGCDCACSDPLATGGAGGQSSAIGGGPGRAPLSCEAACTDCAERDAADLFGADSIATFDLTLPADRWQYLQDHALDELYEPACLFVDGEAVGEVGLRFKGAYGTLVPCVGDNGELLCDKLSMKVKFNQIDPDLRFYGLKRINLHSMVNDSTKLHERLAYDLYREMGVMAPRSSWAVVHVNGQSYGLYSMVEQIDGRFTADRWPEDGDGNLFKEAWPSSESTGYYLDRLETNEETANADGFVQFADALDASAPEDLGATLGQYMDLEYLSRYMAVDDAIFDCDGMTTFYISADSSWSGNHNYYVYQESTREFFWMVPWDMDATFTPWASFSRVPHWDTVPDDCSVRYPAWTGDSLILAPGCDKFFQALSADRSVYQQAIDELLEGPYDEAHILTKIDELSSFIAGAVADDPRGPGTVAWESSVERLRGMIPVLRERLTRLRDGLPIGAIALTASGVNDFEDTSSFGLAVGTTLFANPATVVTQSANSTDPLDGTLDLRLDFEYQDGDAPWDQWMYYSVPLSEGEVDVREMTGIRLAVKADQARTLRLDLESPNNSASSQGIRFGWDVPVSAEAATVEVRFADAAVQSWAVDQGSDPGDPLDAVLSTVTGLAFQPYCVGRDATGYLPGDTTDVGYLELDDIEFFTE